MCSLLEGGSLPKCNTFYLINHLVKLIGLSHKFRKLFCTMTAPNVTNHTCHNFSSSALGPFDYFKSAQVFVIGTLIRNLKPMLNFEQDCDEG